jgi:hypothetical protein
MARMQTQALPEHVKRAVANEAYGSVAQPTPKWIQVDCLDGTRTLVTCYPYDVTLLNDMVIGKVMLYGRIYHCRLQERMPSYRICDRNGRYITAVMPELKTHPKGRWDNEKTFAAPYCWDGVND